LRALPLANLCFNKPALTALVTYRAAAAKRSCGQQKSKDTLTGRRQELKLVGSLSATVGLSWIGEPVKIGVFLSES
jgi:hypothetical protein